MGPYTELTMTKLVALIVEDEPVFALPAWHRTIALLERSGLLVTHVAVIPPRTSQYERFLRSLWCVGVFGLRNALRGRMFAALESIRRKAEPRTWEEMAHVHGLVVKRFDDPNGQDAQTFLRSSNCDVLHALAKDALNPAILRIPRAGVIAHHASLGPSRGVFPFFWARFHGEAIGQSLRQVTAGNTFAGPLLAQREAPPRATNSMLAFQVWATQCYPELALDATQRLLSRRSLPDPAGVETSNRGVPTRRDRLEFEKRGGRISKWDDLRLTVSRLHRLAARPETPAPARQAPCQFPDVLPFLVSDSSKRGKVIPMRPRRQVQL